MRRVMVTGLGVVAPNGIGKEAFWKACVEGQSGIGPIRCFDASAHPVRVAGEVHDFDVADYIPHVPSQKPENHGPGRRVSAWPRPAWPCDDAGWTWCARIPSASASSWGPGLIPIDLPEVAAVLAKACDADGKLDAERLGRQGSHALFPLWLLKYLPNMTAAHISLIHNAQGPNNTVVTACAAGTQAVGEGFRLIARDDADLVLAGGADSRIDPLLLLAYSALGAISPAPAAGGGSIAAVRRPARRLRAGRGGRRAVAGGAGARPAARGGDLRRGAWPGKQFRRLRRDQAGPGGAGGRTGHPLGAERGPRSIPARWTTSTPTAPAHG